MSKKWKDVESYEDLSSSQKAFCDWLATPEPFREIKNQYEVAEKLGLCKETLTRWKYKPTFIRIVQERKQEIVGVDGLNKIIDALIARASKTSDPSNQVSNPTSDARLFFKWFYGAENFEEGVHINIQNEQKQAQGGGGYREQAREVVEFVDKHADEIGLGEGGMGEESD